VDKYMLRVSLSMYEWNYRWRWWSCRPAVTWWLDQSYQSTLPACLWWLLVLSVNCLLADGESQSVREGHQFLMRLRPTWPIQCSWCIYLFYEDKNKTGEPQLPHREYINGVLPDEQGKAKTKRTSTCNDKEGELITFRSPFLFVFFWQKEKGWIGSVMLTR